MYVCAQGFDIGVRERLSTWRLQVNNIDLRMSPNVPATAQPEALRNTLTQLATLPHPPPIHARGSGWHWTPALLHVLAETPPDITSVKAAIRTNEPLTDELLTAMIDTRQHIASVSVPSLKLQSDTLANTPWPCEELTCDTVDVTQMIKFPQVKTVRTKEVFMPVDLGQVSSTTTVGSCLIRISSGHGACKVCMHMQVPAIHVPAFQLPLSSSA